MTEYPQVLSATSMIGSKVVNSAGEPLGTLKELVIDLEEGQKVRLPWMWIKRC